MRDCATTFTTSNDLFSNLQLYINLFCILVNVCDHNPCRNGGTCMASSNEVGYTCECVFPYHGRQCERKNKDLIKFHFI